MHKSLRTPCANFPGRGYPNRDLLAPRRQERQVRKFNFFAAFAPLREIFRVLVAALPRYVLCGRKIIHELCVGELSIKKQRELGGETSHAVWDFQLQSGTTLGAGAPGL
jgi:hypothetical protein